MKMTAIFSSMNGLFIVGSCLIFSSLVQAKCSDPSFGKVKENDDLYSFTITQKCQIRANVSPDFSKIFNQEIVKLELNADEIISSKGTGKTRQIDLIQTYRNEEGTLVTKDRYTLRHSDDKFNSWRRSQNIERSTGRIGATKRVNIDIEVAALSVGSKSLTITVKQHIDVERPWIAPVGLFKAGVRNGLKESTAILARDEINRIMAAR